MRKSHSIETISGIEAGVTVTLAFAFQIVWYFKFLILVVGFIIFSYLIGILKEQTIREYQEALNKRNKK